MSIVNYRRGLRGLGEAPVTPAPQQEYHEEPFELVFNKTLTALQDVPDLSQFVDADGDFVWMATKGTQTGDYEVRFQLPNGRYQSSARIRNANEIGSAQFPVPKFPAVVLPAGSKIGIDIKDLSNAENTVQIVFIGLKRLRVG
jgi:hypothetical protein